MELLRGRNPFMMDISNYPVTWALILVVSVFLFIKWNKWRMWIRHFSKIPGPPPLFLVGNLSRAIGIYRGKFSLPNAVYILQEIRANNILYGQEGMYRFWFASTPIITLLKADVIEAVLSSSVSLDKSWEYNFLHPWLGLGLLTSTGSKWRSRRKILTPAFHFRILEDFIPVFNEQAMVLSNKLLSVVKEEFVDIRPLVTLCTLDIVSESVMGVRIGAQSNSSSEYVKAIHELGGYFNHRTARPWYWPDIIFYLSQDGRKFKKNVDILHRFTRQVIKERKESMLSNEESPIEEKDQDSYLSGKKKRKAFMDLLLDLHIKEQLLSEEDIREEVDTFMFEGHDTTSMAISWSLYCIGLYPKVQKKLVEELGNIFGDDTERLVTHDDVRQMKYMECTLKESQRIYPPVPLIARNLSEDICVRGVTLPRGTSIHIPITLLHRDAKEFPDPEIFDPDRFLPENVAMRHPYSFIPFSAGPRNCIGQKFAMIEEKVVISNILRHFEVTSLDPRDRVNEIIEFVLRPAEPLRLKFIPRALGKDLLNSAFESFTI